MAKRGLLYRCHLFSYGGPQTEGVESFWARDLRPIGDEPIDSGSWVELFVTIRASELALTKDSRIRFDILEEDFLLSGGVDDLIASIKGTGAAPADGAYPKVIERNTMFRELEGGLSAQDAVHRFRCERPDGYRDHLLILQSEQDETVWHVVTWWQAIYDPEIGASEFYFIVNVDEAFEDQTNSVLTVREAKGAPPPAQFSYSLPSTCGQPAVDPDTLDTIMVPVPADAQASQEPETAVPSLSMFKAQMQRNHAAAPSRYSLNDLGLPPDGKSPFGLSDEEAAAFAAEDFVTEKCKLTPWPPELLPHPGGPVSKDYVRNGVVPYGDRLIAVMPEQLYLKTVKSHRYARSYSIVRALQWGWLLFGSRAFAVFEGPLFKTGDTDDRNISYYTVPLDHAIEIRQMKEQTAKQRAGAGGRNIFGVQVKRWLIEHPGYDGRGAILRVVGCANQFDLLVPFHTWLFYCELEREIMVQQPVGNPDELEIPKEMARKEAFSRVKEALGADDKQKAADELTYLGRVAFGLLDPNERRDYIILLLEAWTYEAHERAVVEIVRSVKDYDEFKSLLQEIKGRDKFQKLIDDLDYKLWDLLRTIGERFGKEVDWDMNSQFFADLISEASGAFMGYIAKIDIKVDGGQLSVSISPSILAELQEAAQTLLRFLVTNVEGVWMLLSQPDKVIEGVWQLIKMAIMIKLAGAPYNYPPAQEFVSALIRGIGKQIAETYRGVLLLGAGPEILRRVRWMLLMEIASLLIGVGEIRAALEAASTALRLGDRIAGLARLAKVFKTAGQIEGGTMRMERLAVLMANEGRIISHTEEGIRLLSALPAEDLTLLERALSKANLDEVPDAAKLAKASPEIAEAMKQIEPRLELLQMIESKMVC